MSLRLSTLIVTTCLSASALAQTPAPNLTRQQRELLSAIVTAVDAAAAQPETNDLNWQHHIMRASDGSHYVAFTVEPAATIALPTGPALLYVRLSTATPTGAVQIAERSGVREWLAGSRTDPRLLPKRNIAIGDMPAFGAGGIAVRGSTPSTGSTDLRLMALERERARQEQEERDKKRRAELEGRVEGAHELLPFEDFDLASQSTLPDGRRMVSRALTAGPGDYDLFLAWGDPAASKPATTIRVVHKPLHLPPARTAGLSTSSVIFADSVTVRPAPYPPAEQASHPYSIGLMEITPSRTTRYARENKLAVAFQVINAQSDESGKPDIAVTFRIVRPSGDRELPVATLNPQSYNGTTLPLDFSLKLGHPLFVAVSAPLATLARGDYRLKVLVSDRIAGTAFGSDAEFSVVGTPASLLTEAPSLAPPFKRDPVFEPRSLAAIIDSLAPASPSPQLARALAVARSGKLVDLLIEEPVPAPESGIRTALTGLAFLSIGEASAASQLQRALQQDAPPAPSQFLLGCARALQSRDPDAIVAWQAAIATGMAPALTSQLLAEAYLRRNDAPRAAEVIASAPAQASAEWTRLVASIHLASRREPDALLLLDAHLQAQPGDQEARWLMLHAFYSQFIRGGKPMPVADSERFTRAARTYIDAKGANAALAAEWLKAISSP